MGSHKSYILIAFSALLVSEAWAGKTVNGLIFQLLPPPAKQCLYQPFHVWHEPDAFFKGLKQVKTKGTQQYRKGHDIVANYPAYTTVRVEFWQGLPEMNSCSPLLPAFDPAKLKFHVEWQNASQIVPVKGNFSVSEELSPQTWCEDKCTGRWVYELRMDSQDVPLQSNLVFTIETEEGTRLAKYVGKLSSAKVQQQVHPFDIATSQ
jgi:hypothetical protein